MVGDVSQRAIVNSFKKKKVSISGAMSLQEHAQLKVETVRTPVVTVNNVKGSCGHPHAGDADGHHPPPRVRHHRRHLHWLRGGRQRGGHAGVQTSVF